jgi:hypothetical protein
VAEKQTFGVLSVRTVDGRDLAPEEPGCEHRDVLTRDGQDMCHGSEKDGKVVALQRENARRSVRGALRASTLWA